MSRSISSGITSSVSGGNFDTTSEEISSSLYREWSNRASFYNFARSGITEENRAPNSILTQNCPEKTWAQRCNGFTRPYLKNIQPHRNLIVNVNNYLRDKVARP